MVKLKEAYDITTYDNEILEKKRGKKWEKRLIFFLTAKSWYLKNINTFSPKEIKEEDFHLLFQVSIDSELHVIVLPSVNVNEAILPEEVEEAGPTHRRLRNAQCWNLTIFLPLTPDFYSSESKEYLKWHFLIMLTCQKLKSVNQENSSIFTLWNGMVFPTAYVRKDRYNFLDMTSRCTLIE